MTLVTDAAGFGSIALIQNGCCDEDHLSHGLLIGTQVSLAPHSTPSCTTAMQLYLPLSLHAFEFDFLKPSPPPHPSPNYLFFISSCKACKAVAGFVRLNVAHAVKLQVCCASSLTHVQPQPYRAHLTRPCPHRPYGRSNCHCEHKVVSYLGVGHSFRAETII